MMLFLCACSGREAPAGSGEGLYYYWVEMKSSFPLGMDAVITGLGASGDCVFVCGNSGGSPLLSRVPYKIEDGELNLGAAEKMELPACPAGSRAVSLCWSAGKVYLLLEVPDGQGGTKHSLNASLQSQVLRYASIQLPQLQYLNEQEGKGGRYRLFDGSDGGRSLTTAGCGSRSCYMIPETCKDKEKAWGFLRTLLTAAWQERNYAERATGYPSNVDALETVLKSYASEQTRESLYHLLEGAVFCDYDTKRMSDILVSSMQPYLYGDSDLETALKNAQGRINIYYAEHKA